MAAPGSRFERLVEQALVLLVQIEGASPEAAAVARVHFEQWRQASAERQAAADEAQRRWDLLFALSDGLRGRFDAPAAPRTDRKRRDLLLGLMALGGTGLLAALGLRWHWRQPLLVAEHRTRRAQLRTVTLTDGASDGTPGSTLTLSPDSALQVALYRSRRIVTLAHGEAHFDVAPDADRPFEVRTRSAIVEVVGTAFTVRERGEALFVGVEHGHVRVTLQGGQAVDLRPGQALAVRGGRFEGVRQVEANAIAAWRSGWLVFEDTPLDDALAQLSAYLPADARAADPAVGALKFSGRFRATEAPQLVATLPRILPVSIERRADGGITLHPRR